MANWKKSYVQTECYICGSPASDIHHMLHGSMRAKAEEHNLKVPLCRSCHMALHDKGLFDKELQQEAQRRFEETHTREQFIKEFGKSFL